MDTPVASQDPISQQTVVERPARPIVQRTISVRLNLRVVAAVGAGLIVLGAFLPWIDPHAQTLIGAARLAPVVQGWPSLLIGLIALGVLLLPHADSTRWVSLPAAALGLAAAVIAVASALTAQSALAQIAARLSLATPVTVTGAGVLVTIAGGLLCVIAGLSRPPGALPDAQFVLRPGRPAFAALAASLVVVALVAGLTGAWIASGRSGKTDEGPAAFPTGLLSTPVIDPQITPLRATLEPTQPPLPPTPSPFVPPTRTPFLAPTTAPSPTPVSSPTATPTPTPTATFGSSPLIF